jgi:hypothetical protein
LNVCRVTDVRQTEVHTAEPSVPEPSLSEAETTVANLKSYKVAGTDQILVELNKAQAMTLCAEIHRLSNSIWNTGKGIPPLAVEGVH